MTIIDNHEGRIARLEEICKQLSDRELPSDKSRDEDNTIEGLKEKLIGQDNHIVYLLSGIERIADALGMTWDPQDDIDEIVHKAMELSLLADGFLGIESVVRRVRR